MDEEYRKTASLCEYLIDLQFILGTSTLGGSNLCKGSTAERIVLERNGLLTDRHMFAGQKLLHEQFPKLQVTKIPCLVRTSKTLYVFGPGMLSR